MNEQDYNQFYRRMERQLMDVPVKFHRYLFHKIDWRDRLIGIKGARGVGKSTLMLQHIKEEIKNREEAFYLSLDDIWVFNNDMMDTVEYLYTHGVRYLFLDEVHRYPHWQTLLKNIYDTYRQLHVVFSGSSMLELNKGEADLSRRARIYELRGMSFREYLGLEGILNIKPAGFDDLLGSHATIAEDICSKVTILPAFEKYLKFGFYPFYDEVYDSYLDRVRKTAEMVIDVDYPNIVDVSRDTLSKMKKMLVVIASRVPQTPNMSELFRELGTDRNQGLKMLYALEEGGLISLLSSKVRDLKHLSSPDKIYLSNTTLMYAMTPEPNKGTVRETFFMSQLMNGHEVLYPKRHGDFLIDGRFLFEVGGKDKTFDQIKDIPDSYLAVDGTEIGHGNRIPLWMFGLLW